MTGRYYILKGKQPVPCEDRLTWGQWMQSASRHVMMSVVGDMRISTVFLGLDHQWDPRFPPLLFETMVFDADQNPLDCWRCSTWEEAET